MLKKNLKKALLIVKEIQVLRKTGILKYLFNLRRFLTSFMFFLIRFCLKFEIRLIFESLERCRLFTKYWSYWFLQRVNHTKYWSNQYFKGVDYTKYWSYWFFKGVNHDKYWSYWFFKGINHDKFWRYWFFKGNIGDIASSSLT